jgi:hypothetical protein
MIFTIYNHDHFYNIAEAPNDNLKRIISRQHRSQESVPWEEVKVQDH